MLQNSNLKISKDVLEGILQPLLRFCGSDARAFELIVCRELEPFGKVTRQVVVKNRGDGRTGKVDVLFNWCGIDVAIEIDRKTPRQKSIFKVRSLAPRNAFVVTREPFTILDVSLQ